MGLQSTVALAAVAIVGAVILDWPRALAGVIIGWAGVHVPYATILVPSGVIAVAALGEVFYPSIGRTIEPEWLSFATGVVSAGAAAIATFRVLYRSREQI